LLNFDYHTLQSYRVAENWNKLSDQSVMYVYVFTYSF